MKYPCEDCIVNAICIIPCGDIIFFLDALRGRLGNYIPSEWISSERKLLRILKCYPLLRNTKLFDKILIAYNILHKVDKKFYLRADSIILV